MPTRPSPSSTGRRCPTSWRPPRSELGYDAFALTDHDGLSGSMEFAVAASGLGLRAIHGAEMALEDGRHVTLLVEDATGWRNLCRIVTAAHVHDRDKDEPPPRVPWATLEEHAPGPRLPERLRPRRACTTRPGCGGCRTIFGADHLRVELQRPFQRDDRARNTRVGAAGRARRRPHGRHRQRPCPRALARPAAGRLRRPAQPRDARRLRAAAARQLLPRARLAQGDGGALQRRPPARRSSRRESSPTA